MKRVILLVVLALAVSSCTIRFDSNTTVRSDGSGTLAFEISFDEELRRFMEENGDASFDMTGDLEDVPPGWTVTEFSRDGFEGVRIAVEFADLVALDGRLAELNAAAGDEPATPIFMETSGLSRRGDGFDFEMTISGLEDSLAGASDGGFEGFDPAAIFEDVFEVRYVLTLPGEISSHNADSISGSTLTWNIGLDDEGRVLTAASGGGGGGPLGMILAALALVAVVIVVFVVLQARNRRRRYQTGWGEAPAAEPTTVVAGDPFAAPVPDDAPP